MSYRINSGINLVTILKTIPPSLPQAEVTAILYFQSLVADTDKL